MKRPCLGLALACMLAANSITAWAQSAPPSPTGPAAPQAPSSPGPTTPPGTDTPPAAPVRGALPTLVAEPGDPGNVDDVVLPEKAALSVTGKGTWEEGMKAVQEAFGRIRAELKRLGIAPAGQPLAIFTETTDDAFQFQAMIPIATTPSPAPDTPGFKFAVTPSGKAYRFVHRGAYEDVDSTYETITTYLDAKDIVAKDAFIEEYANDVSDPTDATLEVNIYVQPK